MKNCDWDKVYAEFRLGLYSNRELAARHDVSEAGIRKRARIEGWQKDLSGRVAEAVRTKIVQEDGANGSQGVRGASMRTLDQAIVDAAAQQAVGVQRRHREHLDRLTNFANGLMTELDVIDQELAKDKKQPLLIRLRLNSSKASILESLARTYHRLIPLERQAYGLENAEDSTTADAAREIRGIISGIRERLGGSASGAQSVNVGDDPKAMH